MKTLYWRVCLMCVLCAIPAAGSAQSLADAARKERERQKEAHSTATFTGIATTTTATTSSTAATTPAVKPLEVKDNNGHDEAYWKKLFDQAHADLKRAQDRAQLADTKVKSLNTAYLNRSDIYNKEQVVGSEITVAQEQLDDANKEVEKAQQKVSDLEDQLHKAGGPAGWAR